MKLTPKQKDVIKKLRGGMRLYHNPITPAACWCLVSAESSYVWGNIHGGIINKIMHLLTPIWVNVAVKEYVLNEAGKTIDI